MLLSPVMTAGAWVMVCLMMSTLQRAGKLACMASLKSQGGREFYLEVAQLMA